METRRETEVSRYLGNIAMYQPDRGQTRRTLFLVLLLLTVFSIAIATRAGAAEMRMDGFVSTADIGFRF